MLPSPKLKNPVFFDKIDRWRGFSTSHSRRPLYDIVFFNKLQLIIDMKKLLIGLLTVIIITVVAVLIFNRVNNDRFPIIEAGEPYEPNYRVCESPETGLRIYESYWCGDDSCWSKFYDEKGELIESSNEYGPGSGGMPPVTKRINCKHTTKAYFQSKVQEE